MKMSTQVMNWVLRRVFQTVCRIDVPEIGKIPSQGPYILVGNHVNFLEAPILLPHLNNPQVTGLAKIETWDNPLLRFLFDQWDIIPITRGTVDREAFRRSVEALKQGKILAVSPEGTRSKNGCMLVAKPGVAALVQRSNAPLIPVAFYGHENFWHNLKHLRRTEFHVVVGKPFRVMLNGDGLSRDVRQAVTDEIMCKVAELLPRQYRGYYAFSGEIEYKYVASE